MKIDGFKVDGIANIEHAHLKIEELCALIAPNGYGKSNVLRAIEFGVRFLTADDAERRQMLNGRWMSINTAIYGKDFSFEIAGRISIDGDEQQFVYAYQLALPARYTAFRCPIWRRSTTPSRTSRLVAARASGYLAG